MLRFLRYEVASHSYYTSDLTFDLAYWYHQGYDTINLLSLPRSIGQLVTLPNQIQVKKQTYQNKKRLDQAAAMLPHIPRGRALLGEELEHLLAQKWNDGIQLLYLQGQAILLPGVNERDRTCNRCGQSNIKGISCGTCQDLCAFCEQCLQLGRSKVCTPLYYILDEETSLRFTCQHSNLSWKGKLTQAQQEASDYAVSLVGHTRQRLLIWAV